MGEAPGKSTAPSLQPVAALLHCVLIRISAPSSELIMDLISAFFFSFCRCVIPFLLLVLGGGTHIVVICQHARMFTVHILLPTPWVNSLETLER